MAMSCMFMKHPKENQVSPAKSNHLLSSMRIAWVSNIRLLQKR